MIKLTKKEYQHLADKFPLIDDYGITREQNTNLYIWFFNNVIVPNTNKRKQGDNQIEKVTR